MTRRLLSLLLVALSAAMVVAAACGGDDDEEELPTPTENDGVDASCATPSELVPEADMTKQYPAAPEMTIDPAKEYIATVKTVRGDFKIRLRPDVAPKHVNSFVFLSRDGYFDGVTFHRVIPGFVAQGGDPTGTGSGGPGYTLPGEFTSALKFERGTVGMARTNDPNSAGSQWFVNYVATPNLDGEYTIFGQVTEGMDIVDCLTPRDPSSDPGAPPGDQIITIEISES
jgi:peptidylprolyl isomerase